MIEMYVVVLLSTVSFNLVFNPRPAVTQTSMGPPTMPGAPSSGPPTASGQCKIPGCTRPCFVEKGRAHEFCGRTHAELYKKQQKQTPQPTPTVMYKAPPNQQPVFIGVPHATPGTVYVYNAICY